MIMVAFVEVLVVWSRFWRIYERGFVDLVEGTTKRMALMFGRKTILVKILFWKRVLLLLLDYHGKLYFKLVEIIIRNANPSQTRNKTATISNSLRDSSSQSSIIPQIPTQKKERKEKSTTNRKRARANLPIASKNFVPVNTIIATFKAIRRRTANRSSLPCHGVAIIAYLRMRKRGRPKKNPRPNPN